MQEFEEFWKHYPRRVAKGDARKAWAKAQKKTPDLLAKCLAALAWQVVQNEWDGGKFTPHPSTYLNQERWEDERTLTVEEQASFVSFKAWQAANAHDPETTAVSFEMFRRYQQGVRRAG
jgi:hypothetical protein